MRIRKVLIANRGEIAVRIAQACRAIGVASVAVYSEADAGALHVLEADEALAIGPAPATESYLRIDRLLEAAHRCGAAAVHPGYGFLAERPELARACDAAGLVFVGPDADVIAAMGSKLESRARMHAAGVPVVPGSGEIEAGAGDEALREAADAVGYPLMVKASAGGGGRGLRRVASRDEVPAAFHAGAREARQAFGDGALYFERCIGSARHIEVQILADAHGGCIHLYDRECSIQRRHQKLVEEAPAPLLEPEIRRALHTAALRAARAVGYCGAGTCEFLLARSGEAFFLEMNTRIQVEHGISELICGVDIVAEMIRVAAGEKLGVRQEQVAPDGHAIEVRGCAEDPRKGFMPAPGALVVHRPPSAPHVRLDAGVREGDVVSPHYDSLFAKLMVHGEDREQAIERLGAAVRGYRVGGTATTLPLFARLAEHPAFVSGDYDTTFLDAHLSEILPRPDLHTLCDALALAALAARRSEPEVDRFACKAIGLDGLSGVPRHVRIDGASGGESSGGGPSDEGSSIVRFEGGGSTPTRRVDWPEPAWGFAAVEIDGRPLEAAVVALKRGIEVTLPDERIVFLLAPESTEGAEG